MDIIVLFRVLLKYKWILLAVPVFAAFLAYFLTRGAQVEYKSSTQISTGFTLTDQVTITDDNFNLYEIDVKFSNLIETLKSPLVMSLLGYDLLYHDLISDRPYKKVQNKDFEENLFLQDIDFKKAPSLIKRKLDSTVLLSTYIPDERRLIKLLQFFKYDNKSLNEKINIERVNRTDFLSIEATTNDAELSAYMVNRLFQIYQRYTESEKALRTVSSVRQFATLVSSKREILNEKTNQLKEFKANNNLVNLEVESSATIEQLTEFQNDLAEEERSLRRITLEIESRGSSDVEQDQNTVSGVSNLELLQLRNKINSLNARYEQSGKSDLRLRDSLQIARNEMQRLVLAAGGNNTSNPDPDVSEESLRDLEIQRQLTEENITSIKNKIWSLRRSIGGYANYEVQVSALEDEIELASQDYIWAQEKYNQALDLASSSESSLRQVVEGQPPTVAEPSKRLIISGLSGVSSFVICLIVVLLLEFLDTSIKTSSNFHRKVDLKLLTSLNRLSTNGNGQKDKLHYGLLNFSKEKNKFKSRYNEQIRKLRFELAKHEGEVILFTSCKSGEGKTEMIISSSQALSMRKKRVLIIDTNFRNNSITNFYRAKPVLGDARVQDLSKGITKTKNKYIDVIGCLKLDRTPFEVFPSDFYLQIKRFLSSYSYILLEGPALNDHSDSKELSTIANRIITVFSAKSTIKHPDFESIEFLENMNGKFIGSILNQVEPSNMDL